MFQNAVQSFRNVFGTFPNSIWPPFSISKTNGTYVTLSSLYPTHKGSPFKTSHHYYYCYCSRDVNVYSWGLCRLVTVIQENITTFRSLWTWLGANCVTHTLKTRKYSINFSLDLTCINSKHYHKNQTIDIKRILIHKIFKILHNKPISFCLYAWIDFH